MKTIRRRRGEGKTDYKSRMNMLKSGKSRLVVRVSNRYVTAQIVESDIAKDKVVIGVNSKQLLSKGWPKELSGSLKGRAAAYLTGFMLGKIAKSKVKEAIFDIGLNRNIQKSRIYAVLKGAIDSGLNVPHSKEALPSSESLSSNSKITDLINKLKEKL
jgi:large subunit ribosomal protein L18